MLIVYVMELENCWSFSEENVMSKPAVVPGGSTCDSGKLRDISGAVSEIETRMCCRIPSSTECN